MLHAHGMRTAQSCFAGRHSASQNLRRDSFGDCELAVTIYLHINVYQNRQ